MKNTKENVVLVLKADMRNMLDIAKAIEKKDRKRYKAIMSEVNHTLHVINLLTDQGYFDGIVRIFERRIDEVKEEEQ